MGSDHLPITGTSVGGSATVVLAPAPPRVERRLAGLSAGAAEAERRLRVELEAAAALRVDISRDWAGGETFSLVFAGTL
jgi:hypothetical protein